MGYIVLAKGVQKKSLLRASLKNLIQKMQIFEFCKLTSKRKTTLVFLLSTDKEGFGSRIEIHQYKLAISLAFSPAFINESFKPDAVTCNALFKAADANGPKYHRAAQDKDA